MNWWKDILTHESRLRRIELRDPELGGELLWRFNRFSIKQPEHWPGGEQSGRHWRPVDEEIIELSDVDAIMAGIGGQTGGHVTPHIGSSGSLVATYSPKQSHVMVTVGHKSWSGWWILPSNQNLWIRMRLRLLGEVQSWAKQEWLIPFQCWSQKVSGGVRQNPPVCLLVLEGKWYLRLMIGDRLHDRTKGKNEFYVELPVEPSHDWVTFDIRYRKSLKADGYLDADVNGEPAMERPYVGMTGFTNRGAEEQQIHIGAYSSNKTYPDMGCEISDFAIWKMPEFI